MPLDTIVFVLVALAAFVAAGLSAMFAYSCNSRSKHLQTVWEMSRPAKLAAEVADLHAVVDANKRAARAEFGKLWQKFATLDKPDDDDDVEGRLQYGDGNPRQRSFPVAPASVCDNWSAAQLEGPKSKAAACECAYCVTQRNIRAAEKAAILAERNRAKANGSE